MHINDINGKRIEVTNLSEAIKQAAMFAHMQHADKCFKKMDKDLKIYWKDVLNKLNELKKLNSIQT